MHARFLSSLATGVAGAFVVVASQAFVDGTAAWIAFGVGFLAIALAFGPLLAGERHRGFLGLDVLTVLVGAWTVVASLAFSGTTLHWLTLADGAALAAVAVASLALNELRLTRAVRDAVEPTPVGSSRSGHLAA